MSTHDQESHKKTGLEIITHGDEKRTKFLKGNCISFATENVFMPRNLQKALVNICDNCFSFTQAPSVL